MTSSDKATGPARYQICTRCVMDTSDPEITFDEAGVCSHCQTFDRAVAPSWLHGAEAEAGLQAMAAEIRAAGAGKEYDSILGLSGGVDSSYLAWVAVKRMGLKPLAVHVDAGWNSDQAVRNIEAIVKHLDLDLFTNVIDWEEVRDLQRAYLLSGVENQDTPQDHVFFASLYRFAVKHGIKSVLSGYNYASESILPRSWGYNPRDSRQLKAIHARFGQRPLKTYPIATLFHHYVYWPKIRGLKVVHPLNLVDYDKEKAKDFLAAEMGWRDYGGKHHESRFTKFFQGYWLPRKFGFDKRRAHLSSLILAGQTTREAALEELEKPAHAPAEIGEDLEFVRKKLGFSAEEFAALLEAPPRTYRDYPSWAGLRDLWHKIRR